MCLDQHRLFFLTIHKHCRLYMLWLKVATIYVHYTSFVHSLPAAKIPPGADESVVNNVSCDNCMMMTTTNSQNDHNPLFAVCENERCKSEVVQYPLDCITEYAPSDSGSSECSEDVTDFPFDHQCDESELRDFLLDTFEGVDVMDDMPELSI